MSVQQEEADAKSACQDCIGETLTESVETELTSRWLSLQLYGGNLPLNAHTTAAQRYMVLRLLSYLYFK
mgnify:CR=1 FL=1